MPPIFITKKADLSTRYLRINLVSAAILFLLFALVDQYAIPSSYLTAWIIRAVFTCLILLFMIYSFKPSLRKETNKIIVIATVIVASIGLYAVSMLANKHEYAFLNYALGQCIIITWTMTSFRLKTIEISMLATMIIAGYVVQAIFFQKLHTFPQGSIENASFIANLFLLTTTMTLAIYGNWRYNIYMDRLMLKREQVKDEKRKLARAIKKVEESERLKSAFLANMSHEIRTPMHAVLGFSQLLRRNNLPQEKQEKFIDLIETKGNQLLTLIDNILELSRIDAQMIDLSPRLFTVKELFDSLKEQMMNSIIVRHSKDFLHIEFSHPDETQPIYTDLNRLSLSIYHLLDNAVKFTASGSVRCIYSESKTHHIFQIEDTGIGIEQSKREFIFQRFTQTSDELNRTHPGTGLGLSIVAGLIEIMGGYVEVESEISVGSTFTINLPIRKREP